MRNCPERPAVNGNMNILERIVFGNGKIGVILEFHAVTRIPAAAPVRNVLGVVLVEITVIKQDVQQPIHLFEIRKGCHHRDVVQQCPHQDGAVQPPVNERLFLLDARRLLGGENNLTVNDIAAYRQATMRHQIQRNLVSEGTRKALHDLERDGAITQATRGGRREPMRRETYGELYIAPRDYALVLASYDPSPESERYERRAAFHGEAQRRAAERGQVFDTSERPWWDVWQELTPKLEALDRN